MCLGSDRVRDIDHQSLLVPRHHRLMVTWKYYHPSISEKLFPHRMPFSSAQALQYSRCLFTLLCWPLVVHPSPPWIELPHTTQ